MKQYIYFYINNSVLNAFIIFAHNYNEAINKKNIFLNKQYSNFYSKHVLKFTDLEKDLFKKFKINTNFI